MTPSRAELEDHRSRVRGSLLGGAIGDALGAPVEFTPLEEIRARHGPDGVRGYPPGAATAEVTDDTQMTLFTVAGLIHAGVRRDRGIGFHPTGPVHRSYVHWYGTQTAAGRPPGDGTPGWLGEAAWLYARRAPGTTCLTALAATPRRYGQAADNDSKGCGGVMRSAPFGLLPYWSTDDGHVFDWAAEAAGLTHGHVTGRLASGALAFLVRRLTRGADLDQALADTLGELEPRDGAAETLDALRAARDAAADPPGAEAVERLGGGWVAEEALAIAVYCALCHPGPGAMREALSLAVTHSGDSDSTGAICGNLLGALHGETALPAELVVDLEGRETTLRLADDFCLEFTDSLRLHSDGGEGSANWIARYVG